MVNNKKKSKEINEMSKQIKIYSVGANAFYNAEEKKIEKEIYALGNKIKAYKDYLAYTYLCSLDKDKDDKKIDWKEYNKHLDIISYQKSDDEETEEYSDDDKTDAKEKIKGYKDIIKVKLKDEKTASAKKYKRFNKREKAIYDKKTKERLKTDEYKEYYKNDITYKKIKLELDNCNRELQKEINKNKVMRVLDAEKLNDHNKIAVFDSNLTRVMNVADGKLTENIIIIEVKKIQYKVMEQLINNDCTIKDEKYIYFTSSAGQIRTKKLVFIKEEVWDSIKNNIMCGLSVDDINNSEEKGCNINKYLAYLALCMGATTEWTGFDIDRCIVVPDFETVVNGEVDYIKKETKTITHNRERKNKKTGGVTKYSFTTEELMLDDKIKREKKDITITHSDGCGMILPSVSKVNLMFRLGWFKGLLTSCNFISFIDEYKEDGANYKIKDIWGKEHDLKEENIQIIFSKSQFKMWKYYKNIYDKDGNLFMTGWEVYKACYKFYNCHASKCNVETGNFKEASLNYQMWQTLTDITDEEIKLFTEGIEDFIEKAYTDKDSMLKMLKFNTNEEEDKKGWLQKCLDKYPALLSEYHTQETLKSCIKSARDSAKEGKIKVNGAKYTFLLPDVYSWMQFLFLGKDKVTGLLKNGEVSCRLYDGVDELIVNRSPHLYREWGVKSNIINKDTAKWFISDGVYTSCYDLISKLLQFDNDGDKALVIGGNDNKNKKLIEIAKRNMEGIVPLYYEMGKAKAQKINNKKIYNGLIKAFKSGNVGKYSNTLTSFWNGENKEDLDLAKMITALNNYNIDSAKTMEMPKVSQEIEGKMKVLKDKPYFFQFVKDLDKDEVAKINDSTVNRICRNIENIKQQDFDFNVVGKFNKKMLMKNTEGRKTNKAICTKYDELNEYKDKRFMQIKKTKDDDDNLATKKSIWEHCKSEMNKVIEGQGLDNIDATDIIIKHVFKKYKNEKKTLMWKVFGEQIHRNLVINVANKISCCRCGAIITKTNNKIKYCPDCKNK